MKNAWKYIAITSYVIIAMCLIKHMEG
jgi:hypothetical protein